MVTDLQRSVFGRTGTTIVSSSRGHRCLALQSISDDASRQIPMSYSEPEIREAPRLAIVGMMFHDEETKFDTSRRFWVLFVSSYTFQESVIVCPHDLGLGMLGS